MQYLFLLIEDMRRRGLAIVFISHALGEALTLADRITVLRDAKKVITAPASEFDRDKLVHCMVGRRLSNDRHRTSGPADNRFCGCRT